MPRIPVRAGDEIIGEVNVDTDGNIISMMTRHTYPEDTFYTVIHEKPFAIMPKEFYEYMVSRYNAALKSAKSVAQKS